jgi:uncharacterized protein YjiS (DUF1127 family)
VAKTISPFNAARRRQLKETNMKRTLTSLIFGDRRRREYLNMLQMDDRLLADAGTSRAEILSRIKASHRSFRG